MGTEVKARTPLSLNLLGNNQQWGVGSLESLLHSGAAPVQPGVVVQRFRLQWPRVARGDDDLLKTFSLLSVS